METLPELEKEICGLLDRIEHYRSGLDLVLSCVRIFGLAKNLPNAPSSELARAFFESRGTNMSVLLVNYLLDVYSGKRTIPNIYASAENSYYTIDDDKQLLEFKKLSYIEFLKHHRFTPAKPSHEEHIDYNKYFDDKYIDYQEFLNADEYLDADEHYAEICKIVKVFIRLECQVKCKSY